MLPDVELSMRPFFQFPFIFHIGWPQYQNQRHSFENCYEFNFYVENQSRKTKKKYVCLFLMHKTKLPSKTLFIVSIYHNPEGALISHVKESKMEWRQLSDWFECQIVRFYRTRDKQNKKPVAMWLRLTHEQNYIPEDNLNLIKVYLDNTKKNEILLYLNLKKKQR